ncbi:unnamed protein product [Citrullus colocynthis]|uniref:Uncharacterized protein n=1 Tax=Citrullus colocynthis TaxID=252529 RepID=A0ABP0YFS7_9ROSI
MEKLVQAKLTVLFRFPNHEGYYVVGSHMYLLVCKNLVEKGHLSSCHSCFLPSTAAI